MTWTSWCWDGRPMCATSPVRHSCGWWEPGRSDRSASYVRETGEIHLNSTWDEGIPEEIPHENLYGFAWNPMTLVAIMQKMKGADTARRVGTDVLTPIVRHAACRWCSRMPNWSTPSRPCGPPGRSRPPRRSPPCAERCNVAEQGAGQGGGRAEPGRHRTTPRPVLILEAEAAGGVSTPATQDAAWVTSKEHPWRRDRARRRPGARG